MLLEHAKNYALELDIAFQKAIYIYVFMYPKLVCNPTICIAAPCQNDRNIIAIFQLYIFFSSSRHKKIVPLIRIMQCVQFIEITFCKVIYTFDHLTFLYKMHFSSLGYFTLTRAHHLLTLISTSEVCYCIIT